MKAVITTRYGGPEVLEWKEIEKPVPQKGEILIQVRAAVVGPSDCAFRKGDPFIIKLLYGLSKPKLAVQGVEFAGTIEAVGEEVTRFKKGDHVFGMSPHRFGAYAQYLCLPEDQPVATKPSLLNFGESVAICDGATTALTFLRDVAKVQPGQKVLINGASGAVGAYAVQLAKHFGAEVTGVCSTSNLHLVRSLGADHVIDYTQEDFAKKDSTYDVVFDAIGKRSFSQCKQSLKKRGKYLTTVPTLSILGSMISTSLTRGRRAHFATAGLRQSSGNLDYLSQLAEQGILRPVIDRSFPLEQIAEAHRYVETGRKKGNVTISIDETL